MLVEVKKLYKGYTSVRSNLVEKCLRLKEPLVINYEGKSMTVPYGKLHVPFQFHRKKMISKYNGEVYELVDFLFVEDKDNAQGELF